MDTLKEKYQSLATKWQGQNKPNQTHGQDATKKVAEHDWTEQCGRPCLRLQSTIAHILNERALDTYEVDYVPVFSHTDTPTAADPFTEIELKIRLKGAPFFSDTNKAVVDCCVIQELQSHFGEGHFRQLVSQWGLQKVGSPPYSIRLNVNALRNLETEIDMLQKKIGDEPLPERKARLDTRMVCEFEKPNTHSFNPQHPTLEHLTTNTIPDWMTPYAQPVENLMKIFCNILPQNRYAILFEPHFGDYNPATGEHNEQLVAIACRIMMNGQNVDLPSGDVTAIRFDIVQELRDQLGWANCRELLLNYGLSQAKKAYSVTFSLERMHTLNREIADLQKKIADEVPDQRAQRLNTRRELSVHAQSYVQIALDQFDKNAQLQQHQDKEFLRALRIMTEIMTTFQYAYEHDEGFKAAILKAHPKFDWNEGIDGNAKQRYECYIIYIESTLRYQISLTKYIFNRAKDENVAKFMAYSDYCNDLIDQAIPANDDYFSTLRNNLICAFCYVDTLDKT